MNDIELLFRENIDEKLQPLRDKGCKIYSISRINNFNTCKRQYYYTYVKKEVQKAGIYGILGTACHSDLEDLYEGKTPSLIPKHFNDEWMKSEIFGIQFPVSRGNIKGNYKRDIDTFYKNYKKREGKFISELGFILKIDDKHYLMGYIDLLELREDGKVNIFDFKTSAMFKDKKLTEAGRQLCIYQMALEQLYGLDTIINGWEMLKYIEVQVGTNKPKVVSGREWVDKSSSQLKTLMKKSGMDEALIDMYLSKCIAENNIEILPQNIKDQVSIGIHFKEYPITEAIKEETMTYIKNTITHIELMDTEDFKMWEVTPNDFFCRNLCGFHPKHCQCE